MYSTDTDILRIEGHAPIGIRTVFLGLTRRNITGLTESETVSDTLKNSARFHGDVLPARLTPVNYQ